MKKKIGFIITRDIFYRNYVSDQKYLSLEKDYVIQHILLPEASDSLNVASQKLKLNRWNQKLHNFNIDLSLTHHRRKSKSFEFRIQRRIKPKVTDVKSFRNALKYVYSYFRLYFLYFLTYNFLIYSLALRVIDTLFVKDKITEEFFKTSDVDLFLLPTNGAHPSEWELERLLTRTNRKYFSLVDNWDNFSSKTVLRYRANHYCVWGPQSKLHGWEIQNLELKDISSIGTPRFESYRDVATFCCEGLSVDNYILFVGTTVAFDEFKVLQKLNSIIEQHKMDIYILYRPHPWRENTEFPTIEQLKHVKLDEQVSKQYRAKSSSPTFQPELDYYRPLIANSKFVIGGLTSMLIEAQLLEKQFVGLTHDDPGSRVNPKDTLRGYTHFREIFTLKNIKLINDLSELEDVMLNLNRDSKFHTDPFLEYFIAFSGAGYWNRLRTLLREKI